MKSNFLLVIYLVSAALLYPFLKYYIDSADTLQYITIAKNYSAGNFADAVNSFWSPLIAWLLVPFILLGSEPVFAFKILQVLIGVFTLKLIFYHIERSHAETFIRVALKAACIPLVLSFAFLFSTPDLLLLTLYLWLVTLLKNNRSPLLIGICGATMYYTKGFGFAFFIVAFAAAYLYKFFAGEIDKKKLALAFLKGYGMFFLLCAPWIYFISEKENKFLFSSAGSNAMNLIDPQINPNPFDDIHYPFEKGILSEPPAHAISAWLYQQQLVKTHWSPFASSKDFIHYLKTVLRNIISVGSFHFGTDSGTVLVLVLIVLFAVRKTDLKIILKENAFLLIVSITCTALYILVWTIHRYLWINDIAIIIIFSMAIQTLFQWKRWTGFAALVAFIFLVVYAPLKSIAENINAYKGMYTAAHTLKDKYHLGGNIASLTDNFPDQNHRLSHLICYYTDSRYYGMVSEHNLNELEQYKIDFVLDWNSPNAGSLIKRQQIRNEILLPELNLKIYQLNSGTEHLIPQTD
jgi:hypothetical protein